MKEQGNLRAVAMLSGWRAAVGWACLTFMGMAPFIGISITTGIYMGIVALCALLFGVCCILEAGAAEYYNKYQQAHAVNMDRLGEIIQKIKADSDKGTNED